MIKKILIVDDSSVARKMLKSCLPKDKGYEFHEAADGSEGVEKYIEVNPDVTFMDLNMPVMNGYEAVRTITGQDKDALIIVVTAEIQMKSIKDALAAGAYMVLKKPLKREEINSALLKAEDSLR